MAVVVTGAAGFIGRAVVGRLVRDGVRVVAVDRRPVPVPAVGVRSGVRVLTADLLDRDGEVTDALRDADAVVHLAGCPGVRDGGTGVARRRARDNVEAAARVLDTVPDRVPLVVASSSSVYGGARGGRPSVEGDPLAPRGGYARSKVAVEALCAEHLAAGARVTVARPFTVAGEGQRPDMALSRWLAATRGGRPVHVFGSTQRRRDLTDVRQVATVLVALARLGEPGPVNIGTGASHSLAELLDAVSAALGVRPRVEVLPAADEEVVETLADTRRLRSLLGWVPSTDLGAVVRRQAGLPARVDADRWRGRREVVPA